MNAVKTMAFAGLIVAGFLASSNSSAQAYGGYYSGYTYYPQRSYYASYYYYKPYVSYPSYNYHYCVYYPTRPRYVYYYNPYSRSYWGRYDLDAKGYSMLAEKDRKGTLNEIPEAAFPKPAEMPADPESTDGSKMKEPPAPPTGPVPTN